MSKNLTTLHKKLDRIIEKLGTVNETRSVVHQMAETNRQLARSVGILTKIASEGREEGRRIARMQADTHEALRDIALLTQEALRASRESAERTAEILVAIRKH